MSTAARGAAGYLYASGRIGRRRGARLDPATREAYRAAEDLRRERERRKGKPGGKR